MATTYSTSLRIALLADGEDSLTWGDLTNTNWQLMESAVAGYLAMDASGSSDTTLTANNGAADQSRNKRLKFTGALTGNKNIIVPSVSAHYFMDNETTGSFTLTAKTAAGTGVLLKQGYVTSVFSDGTNVLNAAENFPKLISDNFTSSNVTITGGTIDAGTF